MVEDFAVLDQTPAAFDPGEDPQEVLADLRMIVPETPRPIVDHCGSWHMTLSRRSGRPPLLLRLGREQ